MNIAPELREELVRILDAVQVRSPSSFTFAGQDSNGLAPPMIGLQLQASAAPLMNELTSQLYQHCFSNRFKGKIESSETPFTPIDPVRVELLMRANQSREHWEDGWQSIQSMPNGQVIATNGTLTRVLMPGEFVNLSGMGTPLPPASMLRIFAPRESQTVQPGYYFAFGETVADSSDESSTARFYWNISAEGSAELLQLLSQRLNRWQVPFRFKTGLHSSMHARLDSAVLYVPRRTAAFTYELLSGIHERVRPSLRAEVPLFTLRLAGGLAYADDTGTRESFGMSRSRLLAQGIWLAHCEGAQPTEERLAAVDREFRAEGISLERPWLGAGLTDDPLFAAVNEEGA
ncbi:MAG: T3SS effector HopA1 family protein [Terracidiphilus sp.]